MEYLLQSGSVKENIILKDASAMAEFDIVYDIGKLTAVQEDERTIALKNGEETIYQICAPYMMDSLGAGSDALTLSIEQINNKEIIVTMKADEDWLQAEERAYPVTLDPTISTKTTKAAIDSTFITSGKPSANYTEKFELLIGRESSEYEYCRTLMKIALPDLKPGDMVVNAKMHLCMFQTDYYATGIPDMQINAHQITENWSYDTVTWNNRPTYDTTVLDYAYVREDDLENKEYWKSFDITEAVKGWYEGTSSNYGIELKMASESGTYAQNGIKAYFWPERYNDEDELYPRYQITYRNNKGLEDYWTYTTLSAGTAGTAYINDYTGNLVFIHEDVSTTGELLPVFLQHVYNGYMKNAGYKGSYPANGKGWKMSIQQTLRSSSEYGLPEESQKDYPYAYEDGDGTVHFFYKKTEDGKAKYFDEDGLGLELTISGDTKTIKDKEDNVMTFGTRGTLLSIADANGNTVKVSTTALDDGKNQITKVTDGSGHVIKFTETESGHILKTVTDPSGRATTYNYVSYDDTNSVTLGSVVYPDGTKSIYEYDSSGTLLRAKSSDGSYLRFIYTSEAKGKRVAKVIEYGADGSAGQTVSFDRSKYNTTVIRTSGKDDVHGNEDDLLTTYQFDDFGRTVGTNSKTEDGVYYGGDIYTYTSGEVNSSGSNIKKLNRVSSNAYSSKSVKNRLENHGGEKSEGWGDTYWVNSTSEYTAGYSTEEKLFGNRSFKVKGTTMEQNGGGAYYQSFTSSELVPGSTYTFSGYVKTDGMEKANSVNAGYGACLAVRFKDADGNVTRKYSDFIKEATSTSFYNGWRRVFVTFEVPEGTTGTNVYQLVRNAKGTAYFDGLQLELGSSMNSYNMLENSSFDESSGGVPTHWNLVNANSEDGTTDACWMTGGKALKISGEASKYKYAYQNVPVSGSESDIYIASCWAWAEALPDASDKAGTKRPFEIYLKVHYTDGTSVQKSKKAEFNRDVTGWQRASVSISLSDGDSQTTKTPEKVGVWLRYYYQENNAYFENAQLIKDVSNSYTYDDEGNIISSKENGSQSSAFGYDDNSNLTSVEDAENNLYDYKYNSTHQVTQATAPLGQKVKYTYNSNGTVYTTTITSPSEEMRIKTGNLYNEASDGIKAGAYIRKTRDQNGYYTSYDYDLKSGNLKSTTTPDGTTTLYTYNSNNDLMTKVTSGDKSVSYSYDNSKTKLTSITHNGFKYQFTYDTYGNMKSTSAAGTVLSENTYAGKNGKLTKTTYGNGDTKEYTYTKSGNVSAEKINGVTVGSWIYDYSGQPVVYKDYKSDEKHTYAYDSTGRLIETKTHDMNAESTSVDSLLYSTIYRYDKMNRVSKKTVAANGRTQTISYSYNKNGQPLKAALSSRSQEYGYDNLGRQTSKKLSLDSPLQYNYMYWISKRNEEGSALYKTTQIRRELLGDQGYYYEYDKMGNITLVKEGTRVAGTNVELDQVKTKISYVYDDQNQLIRENNNYLGKTIVYTYDQGGNLTEKKIYAYTTSSDLSNSTPEEVITYGYDSTWKDKLVSYNGEAITYDEIGNPLSYREKTMTWTGRTLNTLTTDGTTSRYVYDASGMRTKKTVGSEVSEYYYSDGQLAYEKRGEKELYYTYDYDGNLLSIRYIREDGASGTYYPAVNSRGDVDAIYNYKGELVAQYRYDSWGKLISIKDADGNEITDEKHIGYINPIRYRGYYYDAETGFYYVSSRYYDPEVGRFINADSIIDNRGVITQNLFAYCGNNPVNNSDASGHLFIGTIVGGIVGGIMGGLGALVSGTSVKAGIATGALSGAAIGAVCDAVTTGGLSAVAGALICGAVSGTFNWVNQVANNYISNKNKGANTNKGTNTRNKRSSINASNKKQNSTKQNNNQVANNLSASIAAVDYGSVVSSTVMATAFAPISYGANNLVGSVFNGTGSGGLNLAGEIIASTFMEVNSSMVQLVIDIFPK